MIHSRSTTNHAEIRKWVESRNGHPAVVKSTSNGRGGGLLRIDFEPAEESLSEVSWEDFFETFDERQLMFVYQESTASGAPSHFCKFVRRDADTATDAGKQRKSRAGSSAARGGGEQAQSVARPATAQEEEAAEEADEDDAWDAEEAAESGSEGEDESATPADEEGEPPPRGSKRSHDGKSRSGARN
jgi:hypothetical protein